MVMMEDLNLPSAVATGHFQADLYTQIRKHHAGHRLETDFRSSASLYLDVRQAETFTVPSPFLGSCRNVVTGVLVFAEVCLIVWAKRMLLLSD